MASNDVAPIIIKKIKKGGGDGHHGGAWKVAYADFVTAMMAFFLLMWLLNATTEKQRKGIADYFNPTIPINRVSGGGDGSFGGSTVFSEDSLPQSGNGATQRNPAEKNMARGDSGVSESEEETAAKEAENEALKSVEEMLSAKSGESMVSAELARHIVTRVTDEGLLVELFDLPGEPLFEPDSDIPTPVMEELGTMIASIFVLVSNEVAVGGYMASQPIVVENNPVWDLSSDRADRTRRLLMDGGLPDGRVQRVTGFADRKPVVANPVAARNNRIELVLLRKGR